MLCIIEKMERATIHEIFASPQGEGPWLGERHIFVRFSGCDIRCRYCDTPAALEVRYSPEKPCRIQRTDALDEFEEVPNPLSPAELTEFCRRFIIRGPSRPMLSLTGGEPLLQSSFLDEWLRAARSDFRIYLETNGIHADAMKSLRDMIDIVSMDFKLPSATGLRPFWQEHKRFLSAARGETIFVKAVVTKDTRRDDIVTSAFILSEFEASIPLILQPAGGRFAPEPALLMEFQNAALALIQDVRVIPQAHKILNVP